ncbi:MAG: ASCH domain-containing protein [Gammaproteobacteria bacterium]|nr:ASCH domain-containing protein [Gammaproteobacteria bacterium]
MPRNMSFAMTTSAVRDQTKTVTRRFGWWFLKPGDLVQPVEKSMGLTKGEKAKKIGGLVQVISTRTEPLGAIDKMDCVREGFPELEPADFIDMLCGHYRCDASKQVNRIEFEYL